MAFYRSKKIGFEGSTNLLYLVGIAGRSIEHGDAVNALAIAGSEWDPRDTGDGLAIGFTRNLGTTRHLLVVKIPVRDILPAFSRLFRGLLNLKRSTGKWMVEPGSSDPNPIVPNSTVRVNMHGVLQPGADVSVMDFQNYATALPWTAYAGKIGVDLTEDYVGYANYTQANATTDIGATHAAFPNWLTFDIKSFAQEKLDRNEDIILLSVIPATYWRASSGGREYINIFNPQHANDVGYTHTHFEALYVPPIVLHKSLTTAGRALDLAGVLNAESLEAKYHLYAGFIDQGETGDPFKYWVRNTRSANEATGGRVARRLVIEKVRALATKPITQTGGLLLRSVDVYDNDGVKLTPRGAWKVTVLATTTQYKVEFQANFTGAYSLVGTGLLFSADNVIQVSSKDAIRIRTLKWSNTGGNVVGDYVSFETLEDTNLTTYPVDSASMMRLIPPTVSGGDSPDTAKARYLDKTYTQRMRAGAYLHTDGGSPRTVLMLGDTQTMGWQVGQKLSVFSGTTSEEATIRAIYLTAATLPTDDITGLVPPGEVGDAIMLDEELAETYLEGNYVTTGLYIDELAKAEDIFVGAGGAASAQNRVPISAGVAWAPGDSLLLINFATGVTQSRIVQTNGGAYLDVTVNLATSLAEGDLVVKQVDLNARSFFVQGIVPEGAALGDRYAKVRVYEARSSVKNIR